MCNKPSALKEKTFGNRVVKIFPDTDAQSPREWSNLGEILYKRNNRYTLGDRECDEEELQSIADDKNNICLPVYAYMHGNTKLSTKPFDCRWDSGQCGIIFVSKEKIKAEWKVSRISSKLLKTVRDGFECELKTFSEYLNGEALGFVVEDLEGNHIDSCWGYYGMTADQLIQEAAANNELKEE